MDVLREEISSHGNVIADMGRGMNQHIDVVKWKGDHVFHIADRIYAIHGSVMDNPGERAIDSEVRSALTNLVGSIFLYTLLRPSLVSSYII